LIKMANPCNKNKRLPPAKGAPAKRVRDCNIIILDNLQIGSLPDNPPVGSAATPLCTRGAWDMVGAYSVLPLCTRGAWEYEGSLQRAPPLHKGAWGYEGGACGVFRPFAWGLFCLTSLSRKVGLAFRMCARELSFRGIL